MPLNVCALQYGATQLPLSRDTSVWLNPFCPSARKKYIIVLTRGDPESRPSSPITEPTNRLAPNIAPTIYFMPADDAALLRLR